MTTTSWERPTGGSSSGLEMNGAGLRFSVLGPVRAWRDGAEVDVGSPQQRLVLAVLILAEGRMVSHDHLLDALWGEDRPRTAMSTVRTYISRLRTALGAGAIVSVGNGYALRAGVCDVAELEELTRDRRYGEALALWQGEPLSGLESDYVEARRTHLAERRLALLERRLGEDIEEGRHAEVVAELAALCAEHPTRERLCGLLMLALYRSGRQSEAIGVFTDTRQLLAEELGIDPSPELTQLHRRIITADPGLDAKGAKGAQPDENPVTTGTQVPRQLPADTADFTGREADIEQMTRALRSGNTSALVVSAVAGAGGMGKTTLAVHVAHRLVTAFPDGQLFVDLQGTGPRPLAPEVVLGSFLRSLGVDVATVSEDLSERAAVYRSVLADRRVLVLLDNAASVAQVRPLLPGAAGCAVLVTSQAKLGGLSGARHLDLEVMDPDEALALLVKVVGEPRVAAEREAASDLMRACGYLPLAIRIVASRLAARPGWSLARMRDRMADERRRLAELRVDDLAVEATFALGYDQLDEAHAWAFRLLAVPGARDLPSGAAAAVLDMDESDAEELCEALVDVSMMESPSPGRYRHHDLLKLFARSRLKDEEERRSALGRLLDFYLATMAEAFRVMHTGDRLLDFVETTRAGLSFARTDAAREWVETEEHVMLACVYQTAVTPGGALFEAALLLDMVSDVLGFESNVADYQQVAGKLVEAAVARGERKTEALARRIRGDILCSRAPSEAAIEDGIAARDLSLADGGLVTYADAVNLLAIIAHERRSYDEAIAMYGEAIRVWRTLGNRASEASVLGNLSLVLGEVGRVEEAVAGAEQAVRITSELGGGRADPHTVYQLAVVLRQSGRPVEALVRFAEVLKEFRRLKQPVWEAWTLFRMAETHLGSGRPERAVDYAEESLAVLAGREQDWTRSRSLIVLGRALGELGRHGRARDCLAEALEVCERRGLAEADDVRALLALDAEPEHSVDEARATPCR
ncbi:BTAD domain-containing putative transcriptional regulator [Nonomuraea sp. 3N208]|uniref:BTAD domain-containing putative transcriptional regulator n=1 Tax=Nonomuraea sp. 3N208 TaxID=3457421 RepID=UPI003FCE929D